MTQPSSATGSRPTNDDRRRVNLRGRSNNHKNECSGHMRKKLYEKKCIPTSKLRRVKNARDYIKNRPKTVMNTPENSSERYADSQMHKQDEMLSTEHKMSR